MSQRVSILAAEPKNHHCDRTSDSEELGVFRGRGRPRHTIWLKNAAFLFLAALREIFDESAYARYLERSRLAASREAYAAFLREHELAKARRPRCC
jgi:hypothetical protein